MAPGAIKKSRLEYVNQIRSREIWYIRDLLEHPCQTLRRQSDRFLASWRRFSVLIENLFLLVPIALRLGYFTF
jgi:hypothetical protein